MGRPPFDGGAADMAETNLTLKIGVHPPSHPLQCANPAGGARTPPWQWDPGVQMGWEGPGGADGLGGAA